MNGNDYSNIQMSFTLLQLLSVYFKEIYEIHKQKSLYYLCYQGWYINYSNSKIDNNNAILEHQLLLIFPRGFQSDNEKCCQSLRP